MKKFNAYNAINGTSALKLDQQESVSGNYDNVVSFPSERVKAPKPEPQYEEIGYAEFLKNEASQFVQFVRQGKGKAESSRGCTPVQCAAIGIAFAAFALFIVLL